MHLFDRGFGLFRAPSGLSTRSESEADESITGQRSRTVKIVKEPQKEFEGGYRSYCAGCWEVAHNSFFPFDENGIPYSPQSNSFDSSHLKSGGYESRFSHTI